MAPVLFADLPQLALGALLFFTSIFLILLVLVQRGRGGGLTGALGGIGGQSAFGTKAGDLFTKITVGVACAWILLCMLAIITLNGQSGFTESSRPRTSATSPVDSTGAAVGGAATDEGAAATPGAAGESPADAAAGAAATPPAETTPATPAD